MGKLDQVRQCAICGKEFIPRASKHLCYCSEECRYAAHVRQKRQSYLKRMASGILSGKDECYCRRLTEAHLRRKRNADKAAMLERLAKRDAEYAKQFGGDERIIKGAVGYRVTRGRVPCGYASKQVAVLRVKG